MRSPSVTGAIDHPARSVDKGGLTAHSSGVSNKVNRNLRNPHSGCVHDECLAVGFGANGQKGNDGIALDFRFDKTVDVLPRDLASLAILAFKPVTRKGGAVLIDIGTQIHFVGIAGAAPIHFHGLTRVLDIVVDFTPDPLARAILGLHRTATRPRTSHVIEALLRQGWCGGKNCLQEYASQYATNGCYISKHTFC